MSNQTIQPKRDRAHQAGNDAGAAFNDNAPSEPPLLRRSLNGLSWMWIALSGAATGVWLVGMGWMAVKFVRWLVD